MVSSHIFLGIGFTNLLEFELLIQAVTIADQLHCVCLLICARELCVFYTFGPGVDTTLCNR